MADGSTDLVGLGGMCRHLLKRVMLVCSLCGRQWEGQGTAIDVAPGFTAPCNLPSLSLGPP